MSTQDAGPRPSSAPRPGRVVAELGRPESAAETAARKAETSRAHRANQTTRNLLLALAASLAIVLLTVLVVVRPAHNLVKSVDYRAVAAQAQPSVSVPLIAPDLPKGWRSNNAEFRTGSGASVTWYVGLLTPKSQFIAMEEGIKTDDTWFGSLLGTAQASGQVTIGGIRWTVYDQRTSAANSGNSNFDYSLAGTTGRLKLVLHGSADNAEFHELANAVATYIAAHGGSDGSGN